MAHVIDEPIKSPMEPSRPFLPADSTLGALLSKKNAYVNPNEEELKILSQYVEQLLKDGQGESIVELGTGEGVSPGLNAEEMEASKATLKRLAESLNADCVPLRERQMPDGLVGEFLLRFKPDETDFMEIRVAVVGNVDAGKSTLLGVLTHGELDDGRGHARKKLFRHKHEKETGRTSSVSNDILGFDSTGEVVNKPVHGQLDWIRICEQSAKVITFIDLAGHERYLKTTVFGMTGHAPNFAMLMIGSNAGIIGMTKEHLGLALALSVPVFVVVTKVDMCPTNVLEETMRLLVRILKSPGCRKIPVIVSSPDDVVCTATNFTSERVCPIFKVSNVTGENLHLLKMFLNLLNSHGDPRLMEPPEFQIDDTFSVPGVGTVVSGTCLQGIIRLNDPLLLGPDAVGKFSSLPIKSIHRKRMPVRMVRGGQTASFALKKVKRSQIRKGMVLISPLLDPIACWEFGADVLILHHPTTISVKYQAMVHVGPIRQTATIIEMSMEHLRTGDKADVRFRFIKNPEYLRTGMRLVFREGKTKAVGKITKVYPHVSAVAQNTRQRSLKKEQLAAQHHHHPPQKPSKRARRHENSARRISESATATANGDIVTSSPIDADSAISIAAAGASSNHT